MATLFQILQFFDANGDPLSLGKLYWYSAGTSSFKDTYVDQAESGTSPNPVILDQEGRIPTQNGVWLRGSYKFVLKDSTDTEIMSLDDINEYDQRDWSGLTASIADLNSTTTTALSKVGTYTVALADRNKTILCDATSGAFAINLPTSASVGDTFRIFIKKTDNINNAVTITPAGGETIDDRTVFDLFDYNDFIGLQSDGSNWFLISAQIRGTVEQRPSSGGLALSRRDFLILGNAASGSIDLTLPAAATVGRGWRIKIKKIDATTNLVNILTPGAEDIDGQVSLSLITQYQSVGLVTNGLNWFIEHEITPVATVITYPYGYLAGVRLENDAGDVNHDIKFNLGAARDTNNTMNLIMTVPLVKRIDANWVAGTGNGGFPSALSLSASTWYHCYLIGKVDGAVDAGFDTSLTASNLLADAAGYTGYRRVGSVWTNATTNLQQFHHYISSVGRQFMWKAPFLDFVQTAPGTSAILEDLNVPLGYETIAIFNASLVMGPGEGGHLYISYTGQNDSPASGSNAPLSTLAVLELGATIEQVTKGEVLCNTSSQCRARLSFSSGSTIFKMATLGWRE